MAPWPRVQAITVGNKMICGVNQDRDDDEGRRRSFQSESEPLSLKEIRNRGDSKDSAASVVDSNATDYFGPIPRVQPGGSLAGNDSFDASSTTSRGSCVSMISGRGIIVACLRVRRCLDASHTGPCCSSSLLMNVVPSLSQSNRSWAPPIDCRLVTDKKATVHQHG